MDRNTSRQLEGYIDQVRERLDQDLLFDLSGMTFLDSSGLVVLLAVAALAKAHGATVHLAAVHPIPARLLEITGAREVFVVHSGVEQALAFALEGRLPPQDTA
ncbi:STAS domain-containing protein [Nonomuraea polychroma]|uniref:STAS domain-containing protein n=1 Tax=Nonomuraea polychroma TaxID=46176 RepID=UPI003D938EEC